MVRIDETELLDDPTLPDDMVERAYRDIAAIHRWLGDRRAIRNAIRADRRPVRRILDVGCGTGLVLQYLGETLGADVVGADIEPRLRVSTAVPIIRADACRDLLPAVDVAFCMHVCHHLPPRDVIRMIRNVGRSCRRFILLDLVRHPLPLALFRMFVAPFICELDAEDGRRSVRRSYTPAELRALVAEAVEGTDAQFRMTVTPFWLRQMVDISYAPVELASGDSIAMEGEECLR
jgi:2-polyprenyl-3-methyl-5-hydroxy-6-metoxy-1,4-benzoquinol methylase